MATIFNKQTMKKEFKFEEGKDYYLEKGMIVLTESYLAKRGKCCGSGCLFCPYQPQHTKGSTDLRKKSDTDQM